MNLLVTTMARMNNVIDLGYEAEIEDMVKEEEDNEFFFPTQVLRNCYKTKTPAPEKVKSSRRLPHRRSLHNDDSSEDDIDTRLEKGWIPDRWDAKYCEPRLDACEDLGSLLDKLGLDTDFAQRKIVKTTSKCSANSAASTASSLGTSLEHNEPRGSSKEAASTNAISDHSDVDEMIADIPIQSPKNSHFIPKCGPPEARADEKDTDSDDDYWPNGFLAEPRMNASEDLGLLMERYGLHDKVQSDQERD